MKYDKKQIRIFRARERDGGEIDSFSALEDEVNEWLKENEYPVTSVTPGIIMGEDHILTCILIVTYEAHKLD